MSGKFALAQYFVESNPSAAARIFESAAPAEASSFFESSADIQSSNLLAAMVPFHAARCISLLSTDTAVNVLSGLAPRATAEILRHVPRDKAKEILERLPRRSALRASILLNYSLSMVGAWVDPAVLVLLDGCSIEEAQSHLRKEANFDFHRIYVVDGAQMLRGFVKLNQLLQADPKGTISGLIEANPFVLNAAASLDAAINSPGWEHSDYLPVTDRHRKFVGGLRYAALRKALANPRTQPSEQDLPGTFMDLAETCYLGLAEVMSSTLAAEQSVRRDGDRSDG